MCQRQQSDGIKFCNFFLTPPHNQEVTRKISYTTWLCQLSILKPPHFQGLSQNYRLTKEQVTDAHKTVTLNTEKI